MSRAAVPAAHGPVVWRLSRWRRPPDHRGRLCATPRRSPMHAPFRSSGVRQRQARRPTASPVRVQPSKQSRRPKAQVPPRHRPDSQRGLGPDFSWQGRVRPVVVGRRRFAVRGTVLGFCPQRLGWAWRTLCGFPAEPVGIDELACAAVHRDAVRPFAVRGDAGVLGNSGAPRVERQLDGARGPSNST